MNDYNAKDETPAVEATREEWVKPAIVRMNPGSAESGGRAAADGPAGNS